MITLAKIAVINFLAFLLVSWLVKPAVGKKDVSLNTGAFMGAWLLGTIFLLWFTATAILFWNY